jgi:hypothetical protein
MARRLLLLLASAVLCLSGACRDSQVVSHSFATMAEARREGAVERGWLPALVPPGAHDIREAHDNADTGRRWGLFSFQAEDAAALRSKLGQEMSLRGQRTEAPPRIEWWPIQLRGTLDGDRLGSTGLTAYPVTGDRLIAAVNWNQRRAYYWSPR